MEKRRKKYEGICESISLKLKGYGYAIVGDVNDTGYYQKAVGAIEIPDSSPGIYKNWLKKLIRLVERCTLLTHRIRRLNLSDHEYGLVRIVYRKNLDPLC
jgi:hypothetical protein